MMFSIPKIFHYVWLGRNPIPPVMLEWQEKWSNLHPGWQIKTWKEFDDLPPHLLACKGELVECRCPAYLTKCSTPAKRSDVWRYDILEQQGGVYLDTDFEPIKNIEPLLDDAAAFAGLCQTFYNWQEPAATPSLEVGCSIMGATAHHPWLRDLCAGTPLQDPATVLSLAFPFLTEVTGRHPDVRLFEPKIFYPITWDRYAREDHHEKEELPESTHAVHRWSSTWLFDNHRRAPRHHAP